VYWKNVHNEKLNDVNSLANIFRGIKSRRMKLAEHVARMGERRGVYRILWGILRERDHSEEAGVKRWIILRRICRNRDGDLDWIELTQDRDR